MGFIHSSTGLSAIIRPESALTVAKLRRGNPFWTKSSASSLPGVSDYFVYNISDHLSIGPAGNKSVCAKNQTEDGTGA